MISLAGMISLTGTKKQLILSRFRTDPIFHIEKIQGVTTLLSFQKKVIESVAKNERTAVRSAHNLGKTFTAAKLVLWFTSVHPGSKIISSAPTSNQVKRLLWSEIRAGYVRSKYPLGGEMLLTEWKIAEDWFALGFTARAEKTEGEGQGKASSFQGFHAPYVLVIFDEATGIPGIIWKQVEGLLTSGFVRFLALGNPTTKNCEFAKCFTDPSYKKIKLSCFDSPNFPANGLYDVSDLEREVNRLKELTQDQQFEELAKYKVVDGNMLTVRWVMRLALKYGLTHPLVVSKAFADFPEEDEHTLIGLGLVEAAQYRFADSDPKPTDRLAIGVDVARFGGDKSVITVLLGPKVVERKVLVKRDINEVTGEVVRIVKAHPLTRAHIVIDATGIGSGVVDSLKEKRSEDVIRDDTHIRELHFGWSADALEKNPDRKEELKNKYGNMKAYIFVLLSQDIKEVLCLPDEDIYGEELPTIQYKFDSKGRWCIESKDDYKARTGRDSPDDSDSLALANYGRYEAASFGEFPEAQKDLPTRQNSTIIQYPQGEGSKLW